MVRTQNFHKNGKEITIIVMEEHNWEMTEEILDIIHETMNRKQTIRIILERPADFESPIEIRD